MDDLPGTSSMKDEISQLEIQELAIEQGVCVWGTNQQTLEDQASQEIDIFTKNTDTANINLEDGEIVEPQTQETLKVLDINSYIQRQEQLKKIQQYKRTLKASDDKSKVIADKISQIQQKAKLKRKHISKAAGDAKQCKKSKIEPVMLVNNNNRLSKCGSGSEYTPSDTELADDPDYFVDEGSTSDPSILKSKRNKKGSQIDHIGRVKDDGCLKSYKLRLENYYKDIENENSLDDDSDELDYYTIKGGLKIPLKIWTNLYSYQQDGVRWLWMLHQKNTGGLLGDEMGLGKTIEVIAFLAGLEYSQASSSVYRGVGPSLVICPATVIHQWVEHFHDWCPEFRVAILHQCGSFLGNRNKLIKDMNQNKCVLVTSYSGFLKHKHQIYDLNWHYIILDEGHKIRNPSTKVTVAVKQIRTPHRLLLTGSPMQNNLQELWSLFDFTNPDLLGTQIAFMENFNNPIVQGGYSNATAIQEETALQVATTLKTVITPYLLRRSKREVQEDINLPNKSEQVLFCSLTDEQRDLYRGYLLSDRVGSILNKDNKNWFAENNMRASVLVSITTLRKICNHPDIYLKEGNTENEDDTDFSSERKIGHYKKSGKMIVVSALLKIWKKQKHRTLLFTQSRAMVVVFEAFLIEQGYKYLKMDGSTAVSSRQPLINKFNEDSSYDVFLLTTRVGGLGVNLTGANRVIIYDPDWNPATDTQARERAWRIGQDKQVTIYRLLSAGTIEEKMYQRQVWKQLLSNKVLLDPKTRRFFNSSNLHDLFSLPDNAQASNPETANIFRDSRVKLEERLKDKREKRKKVDNVTFSEEKIQAMKNLAQQIAKGLSSSDKPETKKSSYQIELENERKKKLADKQQLKKLSAAELLLLNREKFKPTVDEVVNSVDDLQTGTSFDNALIYSEHTAKLYHDLKTQKAACKQHPEAEDIADEPATATSANKDDKKDKHKKKHQHKDIYKRVVDETGFVDGERVDGLVKTEIKKLKKKHESQRRDDKKTQDYILEKLFTKKGVSGALQHDSVVEGGVKRQSLKVETEAKLKADKALEALRKSRLRNWRW